MSDSSISDTEPDDLYHSFEQTSDTATNVLDSTRDFQVKKDGAVIVNRLVHNRHSYTGICSVMYGNIVC